MDNLIYTSSVKSIDHLEMAKILVKSLRHNGRFIDDILVVTDHPDAFIDLGLGLIIVEADPTVKEVCGHRFCLERYINVSKYNRVMYLDDDIICEGDINNSFQSGLDELIYFEENRPVEFEFFNKGFESDLKGVKGINSGQWVAGRDLILGGFLKQWLTVVERNQSKEWWNDQPAFNYMIRKGIIKSRLGDPGFVSFDINSNDYPVIRHYAGCPDRLSRMVSRAN